MFFTILSQSTCSFQSDYFLDLFFCRNWIYFIHIFHNSICRFLWCLTVRLRHMLISPQMLGRAIYGNGPAVLFAKLVLALPEITNTQICLHLQPCYRASSFSSAKRFMILRCFADALPSFQSASKS